jgi:hypothetical protein
VPLPYSRFPKVHPDFWGSFYFSCASVDVDGFMIPCSEINRRHGLEGLAAVSVQ